MTDDDRARLRAYLLETGIAGDTRTTRENSVSNARKLAEGDPDKHLGIGARGRDFAEVMKAVSALCGCDPSCDVVEGPGVIDPDRTLEELVLMGDRLEKAATAGERVLVATGHPTGLLPMYQAVSRALVDAGASIITPLDSEALQPPRAHRRRRSVRYLDGVGTLMAGADLLHTHESWPMEYLLDAERPDLVLADHGWAGAAIMAGVQTVCFTDVNDPALAVAWEDGLVEAVVPLDDNLPPVLYEPIKTYLTGRIGQNGSSS